MVVSWARSFGAKFVLADVDEAHDEWGANCGPTALAAALGKALVEDVHDLVRAPAPRGDGPAEFRGFMAPRDMLGALAKAGVPYETAPIIRRRTPWPRHGLVRIQWEGPWIGENIDPRAAYQYTHWIAARQPAREETAALNLSNRDMLVFDGNLNLWIPLELWTTWSELLWPKRTTGWHVASCINLPVMTGPKGQVTP